MCNLLGGPRFALVLKNQFQLTYTSQQTVVCWNRCRLQRGGNGWLNYHPIADIEDHKCSLHSCRIIDSKIYLLLRNISKCSVQRAWYIQTNNYSAALKVPSFIVCGSYREHLQVPYSKVNIAFVFIRKNAELCGAVGMYPMGTCVPDRGDTQAFA